MTLCNLKDIVNHRTETNVVFVLQTYNAGLIGRNGFYILGALQQALRL